MEINGRKFNKYKINLLDLIIRVLRNGNIHHERYIGLIRPNTLLGDDLNMP